MIDLEKGGLLISVLILPYRFVVPLPVRQSELLDFSNQLWKHLERSGFVIHDLTQDEIGSALSIKALHPALSANDCFCCVSALTHEGIILTGDALLRRVAASQGLQVHGVLWMIDQLEDSGRIAQAKLVQALRIWRDDDTVFLPTDEITQRIDRLTSNPYGIASPSPRYDI